MKKLLSILLLSGSLLLTGCGDSENFVFTTTPNNQVAPVCVDDAYSTNQNTQLTVNAANGVLANDSPNGGSVTEFDATSTQGGAVNVNGDGSFTYTPPNNFFGATDTFTYTVTNDVGQTTCTVTITVVVVNGFFVDSVNGNDTTGSFNGGLPFQTVQAAVTAAGTNQDIIVRPGNYSGVVTLLDGQRLLGSGSSLVNPQGGVRPVFTGPINMADGNTVDFVRVENAPDDSIVGDGQNHGTISNCEIDGSGTFGISCEDSKGSWDISGNNIQGNDSMALGIVVDSGMTVSATQVTFRVNNNVINRCDFGAISVTGLSSQEIRAQISGNSTTNTVNTGATIEGIAFSTSEVCADITGNTNDDAYSLGQDTNALMNVEQLSQLTVLNSGSATVEVPTGFDAATEVSDGVCGF